jgi:adenylate cyclase
VGAVLEQPGSGDDPARHVIAGAFADGSLALPERPSIVVLPFQNMSSDPEQDYFADGMTEDIITALSRFKSMFVIARNTSFTYKGRSVDVKHVGRELGVRYVLEGSVRKAGERVRITGQLIEAATGTHLWASAFDGKQNDIFELQDSVTRSAVGAIVPKLFDAEIDVARRKPSRSWNAYDRYLRGMALVNQPSRTGLIEAKEQFRQALELDPDMALARAAMASCTVGQATWFGGAVAEAERSEALAASARAADMAPDDERVLALCAINVIFLTDELERAILLAERAIDLNPNLSLGWTALGWANTWLGELERAHTAFDQAIRLNPLDKPRLLQILPGLVVICWLSGDLERREKWLNKLLALDPTNLTGLLDLWDLAERQGRPDAAAIRARLRATYPGFHALQLRQSFNRYRKPEHRALFEEFVQRLGLPE